MNKVEQPTTINLVTFQIINKDGSIAEEKTVTNKYLAPGYLVNSNGINYDPQTQNNNKDNNGNSNYIIYYNNSGIDAVSNSTSLGYKFGSFFRYLMVSSAEYDPAINSYLRNSDIPGNKVIGNYNTLGYGNTVDVDLDFVFEGKSYITNNLKFSFNYGEINGLIKSIYITNLNNVADNGSSRIMTAINIPTGISIAADQRLQVIYRLLFDYQKYYTGNPQDNNLELRPEYQNILLASGNINNGTEVIPFNLKISNLLTKSPRLGVNGAIRLFNCYAFKTSTGGATTSKDNIFYYNTNQTYNYNFTYVQNSTISNYNIQKLTSSDGVKKSYNIVYPATIPALNQLRRIDIEPLNVSINTESTFFIEFTTPWNKPAEMEIGINMSWDEIWSQG